MAKVRNCYNESCECNVNGAYCEADEVFIGDDGMCWTYYPKIEKEKDDLEV